MQEPLMQQGLNLMLYGMGTVFAFLTVLIIATALMSRLMTRFFPEPAKALATPAPAAVDPRTLAIIKAAIEQHRKRR